MVRTPLIPTLFALPLALLLALPLAGCSDDDDNGTGGGDGETAGDGTDGGGTSDGSSDGAASDGAASDGSAGGSDGSGGATDGTGTSGDGSTDGGESPACEQLQQDAFALVDSYTACTAGDACILVDTPDLLGKTSCLLAFGCPTAFHSEADVDAFVVAATELDGMHDTTCESCPDPMCRDPELLDPVCDEATGTCVLQDQ